MPKGYWVTAIARFPIRKSSPPMPAAPPAIAPFGGRYLVRGTAAAAFEAGQKERIVMSEFPSVEKAIAAYRARPIRTH